MNLKEYFEVGTSWWNPPLTDSAQKHKEQELQRQYVQFRKDVQLVKAETMKEQLLEYSFKDFVDSKLQRVRITDRKIGYVKKTDNSILDILKEKNWMSRSKDVMFSFDG